AAREAKFSEAISSRFCSWPSRSCSTAAQTSGSASRKDGPALSERGADIDMVATARHSFLFQLRDGWDPELYLRASGRSVRRGDDYWIDPLCQEPGRLRKHPDRKSTRLN